MRSTRRTFSVSNEEVEMALDRSENVSKYIENAILYYLEHHKNTFVKIEEFNELKEKVEEDRKILGKIIDIIGGRK